MQIPELLLPRPLLLCAVVGRAGGDNGVNYWANLNPGTGYWVCECFPKCKLLLARFDNVAPEFTTM